MATIVNNPGNGNSGNGMGMVLSMLILLVIVVLFFIYGLPAIRQMSVPKTPQINIPSEIDVNVNQPEQ